MSSLLYKSIIDSGSGAESLSTWNPTLVLRVNGCSLGSGRVWVSCSYQVSAGALPALNTEALS